MQVKLAKLFKKEYDTLSGQNRLTIAQFIHHIEQFGFVGLKGRNKSSDNVPIGDPKRQDKIRYAQTHRLWHYHIGIPTYQQSPKGDHTSQYVLHYMLGDDYIVLVGLSAHPPFELPSESYLKY